MQNNKKNVLSYIYRIIIALVVSVILGLSIYVVNVKKITEKKLFMPFDKTIAVVLTGSMAPTITESDLIVIEKTDDYQIDDIVVYQDGAKLVVHRIVKIEGDQIRTSGDANNGSLDDPIVKEQIYGEVIDIIPFLGLIFKVLKSPIGIVTITGLAIYLLVLSYRKEKEEKSNQLQDIKKEIEKLKNELKG